jgi:methylated-DNA-[protein]-cysteine S-methyltransferase
MFQSLLHSPVGTLLIEGNREAVTAVRFVPADTPAGQGNKVVNAARTQLRQYFAGKREIFDVPLDMSLCTPFQRMVLKHVAAVELGQTTTYAEIARKLKKVAGARAVGRANAHNPISIIIPCHRVISSNGKLTGYGGGLPAKEWLLKHEKALLV